MHERALLALVALVAVAGCVGGGPATDATATPAQTSSPHATTPFPNETVAFPPGPKSRPALPDRFTAETARSYAITHEYRYSYNRLWSGPDTEVGLSEASCSVESTDRRASGYVVVVRCTAYVNEPAAGENTTRTIHADYPPWSVRYYLDENSVVRTELA